MLDAGTRSRLHTPLCDLLKIDLPIIQAPIGSATCPALAAAVSNAGGLGTLAISWTEPDAIEEQLNETRRLTARPFGVNLVLAQPVGRRFEICLAHRVPVVLFSWGEAAPFVRQAKDSGLLVGQTVGDPAEAKHAASMGVDFVVAQGWEAGGHVVGRIASMPLIPSVVDAINPIPVVAAGGIGDGRGIAAALVLGASGAALGTRFLATEEAVVHPIYKERIIHANATDTEYGCIFDRGWPEAPHRVLRNETTAMARSPGQRAGEDDPIAFLRDGSPVYRYSDVIPLPDMAGDVEALALYAGQSVGLISNIKPAGEVVHELASAAAKALR